METVIWDSVLARVFLSHIWLVMWPDYDQVLTELTQSHWGDDPHHGVDQILSRFTQSAYESSLMQQSDLIELCFAMFLEVFRN